MKTLVKVVGVIVACAILVLLVLRIHGLDPNQRRAGVWLRGSVSSFPADWSFADKYPTLMVETHPWYLVAHSVNIYFVTNQGNLYLHADYEPGGKFPNGKTWTSYVGRDPNVRVKIGNQVFAGKVVLVNDQTLFDMLFETFRKKYPRSPYGNYKRKGDVYFLHFIPQ